MPAEDLDVIIQGFFFREQGITLPGLLAAIKTNISIFAFSLFKSVQLVLQFRFENTRTHTHSVCFKHLSHHFEPLAALFIASLLLLC